MPTPETAAGVLVQRTMMIDDGEDHDVLRLEELLRAQTKRVQELESDLHRSGRLLRQLTEQLSAAPQAAGAEDCLAAGERAAWAQRAVDAEAARVELLLRLDVMQGRLQLMEAAAQDQAPLREAIDGAEAALTAARFRALELERELTQLRQERLAHAREAGQRAVSLAQVEAQVEQLRAAAVQAREREDRRSRDAAELETRRAADQRRALVELEEHLLERQRSDTERSARELAAARQKADELGQSLSAAQLQAEAALAREDAAREELLGLRQQRAAEAEQLLSAQRALADAESATTAEMGGLSERLQALEAELRARSHAQDALRSEGEVLREQLQARQEAFVGAQTELSAQRERAQELERLQGQLQMELASTRAQLSELAESAAVPKAVDGAGPAEDESQGSVHQQAPAQLVARLVQANRLLENLRAALIRLATAHERDAEGAQVASRATLAGTTDAVSTDEDEPSEGEQRLVDLEDALETEKKGRGEDRREARRQIHALKTECQIMRARFEDEQARVHTAIKAAQAIQKDLLPGDPMYGRLGEVLTALEGNG